MIITLGGGLYIRGSASDGSYRAWGEKVNRSIVDTLIAAITAEDVGALSNTGGTITGNLHVSLPSYPVVYLHDTTNNSQGSLSSNNHHTDIGIVNVINDALNQRTLQLFDNTRRENKADALCFVDVVDGVDASYTLYGEHNKPSGSYTGNGDATIRGIPVPGLGMAVVVFSYTQDSIVLLTQGGGIIKQGTVVTAISRDTGSYNGAEVVFATTNAALNANGVTYNYQVL